MQDLGCFTKDLSPRCMNFLVVVRALQCTFSARAYLLHGMWELSSLTCVRRRIPKH